MLYSTFQSIFFCVIIIGLLISRYMDDKNILHTLVRCKHLHGGNLSQTCYDSTCIQSLTNCFSTSGSTRYSPWYRTASSTLPITRNPLPGFDSYLTMSSVK